jgi:hypothetical protein
VSQSADPPEETPAHHPSIMERLRGGGVGTEDPNIVGDAGPTDVAPGQDPPLRPLDYELPPEEETASEQLLPSDDAQPVDEALPVDDVLE